MGKREKKDVEYSESKEKLKNQRSSRNQNSRNIRQSGQGARLQGATVKC